MVWQFKIHWTLRYMISLTYCMGPFIYWSMHPIPGSVLLKREERRRKDYSQVRQKENPEVILPNSQPKVQFPLYQEYLSENEMKKYGLKVLS